MPARMEIRKNFFSNRVAKKWNAVPHEIKRANNVDIFKMQYNKLLRWNASSGQHGQQQIEETNRQH
jgi:hypothetical protein